MSIVLLSVVAGGTLAVASTTPSRQAGPAMVAETPCSANTCTLTVHPVGNGGVHSDDGMIICLHDGAPGCSFGYNKGDKTTLNADPGPTTVFSYWGGDCAGSSATCDLTMEANKTVYAVFSSGSPQPSPSGCPTASSSPSTGAAVAPAGPGCTPTASASPTPCPSGSSSATPCPSPTPPMRPVWTTVVCARKTKAKADACLTQHLRNHGYGVERDGPGHFEAQKRQPSKSKAVLAAQNLRSKGFKDAHAEREE